MGIINKVEADSEVYTPILQDAINQYGIVESDGYEDSGLVYAKVADFDGNGSDELYYIALIEGGYQEYLYGGSELVYENTSEGPGAGRCCDNGISIAEGDNAIYIAHNSYYGSGLGPKGVSGVDNYTQQIYGHANGSFKSLGEFQEVTSYYELEMLEYYNENGELEEPEQEILDNWDYSKDVDEKTEYYYNQELVSENTYKEYHNKFANLNWKPITEGAVGSNMVVIDSKAVINQVLSELEEQSVPTNLGEDIKDSMDKNLFHSLTKWLTYSEYFKDGYSINEVLPKEELMQYFFMPNGGARYVKPEYPNEKNIAEFPKNTFSRMKAENVDNFLAIYLGQELPVTDFQYGHEEFPYAKKNGYYYFPDFAMGFNSNVIPYIRSVYELADNIYYIQFTEYEAVTYMYENYSEEKTYDVLEKELLTDQEYLSGLDLPIHSRGYAVMKMSVIDGEYQWTLIERNTQGKKFDESILDEYKKISLTPAQLKLDLSAIGSISSIDDMTTSINEQIKGKALNEQDKLIISDYLSLSLQKLNQVYVDANRNQVSISAEDGLDVTTTQQNEKAIEDYLKEQKISLTKNIQPIYRFNVNGVNFDKPISVTLNQSVLDLASEKTLNNWVYVSLDGSQRGFLIRYTDLATLFEEVENVTVELTYSDKAITTQFKVDNSEVDSLPIPIQILVPTNSEYSTVMFNDEVWGGQYNPTIQTIVFETKSTGDYTIEEKSIELSDISKLPEEQQEAIQYLTNRGFFDVEGTEFMPDSTISRNDYAKTLVRLFYALEPNAKTTFTDVAEDSPYYQFIASGEQNAIIEGYEDSTFRGDTLISISHVLSFAGRTLANKKGYAYPENPEDYLQFVDSEKIQEHAREEIALAVREGLIDQGGLLTPQRQITRAEAADILYKLYMLLYEEPMYLLKADVEEAPSFWQQYNTNIIVGGIAIIATIGGLFFRLKRRRNLMEF